MVVRGKVNETRKRRVRGVCEHRSSACFSSISIDDKYILFFLTVFYYYSCDPCTSVVSDSVFSLLRLSVSLQHDDML